MEAEIAAELDEAVAFARNSPFPDRQNLERDIYG
jgi:hypothetical protein